jgi:predicted transcriptional regulator
MLSGLEIRASAPTRSLLEISLAPEPEQKLARIASEAGKAANEVVQDLVADYLDHDEWCKRKVQKGLASLDSGSLYRMRKWAVESSAS